MERNIFEITAKLKGITKSIYDIYNKLLNLEKENKKDSEEYKYFLETLSTAIAMEAGIYGQISDINTCLIILNLFERDEKLKKTHLSRATYKLYEIMAFLDQERLTGIISSSENQEISTKLRFISDNINNEFYQVNLYFLEHYKPLKEDEISPEELIAAKYKLYFVSPVIESEMIRNNFTIPDQLYFSTAFFIDLLRVDKALIDGYYNSTIKNQTIASITNLLSITDYSDTENRIDAIIYECKLRAYLIMLSPELVDEINFSFHVFIESNKNYLKNQSPTSEKKIINCFKHLRKDRTKFYEISGPKKR